MNIDSILKAIDKIDSDRDKIAQRRADKIRGKVIERERYPHPTGYGMSIIDIASHTPNAN